MTEQVTATTVPPSLTDDQRRRAHELEILKPSFYTAFAIYYAAFVGYGLTVALLGTVTIQETSPDLFGQIWGYLVAGFGLIAGIGLVLSRKFKKPWVEVIGTILLIGLMIGYIVAIISRGATSGDLNKISAFWLPIIVSIFPVMRILWLANDGQLLKKHHPDTRHVYEEHQA